MSSMLQLIENMRNGIYDSTALTAFCHVNFGRKQIVIAQADERNPPKSSDYPLVHIEPDEKIEGYDLSEKDHSILLLAGIHIADASVNTHGREQIVEYKSLKLIEEYRILVRSAAFDVDLLGCQVAKVETTYRTSTDFPFLFAGMAVTLTEEFHQGDEVFD